MVICDVCKRHECECEAEYDLGPLPGEDDGENSGVDLGHTEPQPVVIDDVDRMLFDIETMGE